MNEKIYGIDLGTTNSCISLIEAGRPRVVPIDGDGIVPSVVSFDGSETLVGRRALNRYAAFPEESVRSVKRLMGGPDKIKAAGRTYDPEDISAAILGYLRDEAQRIEGHEVRRVVVTVPAYFSDAQRRATIDAGERAGLKVERIVNEPTAAALFYDKLRVSREDGLDEDGAHWRRALVYDLGGGTFDVSILRMGEIIEVLSSTGDTRLGGDDFDERLLELMLMRIEEEGGPSLMGYRPAIARLRTAAERAKIELSTRASALIEEANIPTPDGTRCSLSMEITREAFQALTAYLIDRTIDFIMKALDEADLRPGDIDRVLLVGGMTRMPAVSERLAELFGDVSMPVVDPDRSVALGAAIQGGIISGEETDQILLDVTAHTLSTAALSGDGLLCVPIIPRNTPIPATRSRMFYSMAQNQRTATVEVYQGESGLPKENTLIGRTVLQLAKAEEHCPIVIEYAYDLNGIIRVTAEQKGYSRRTEVRMDSRNPAGEAMQEINEMADDGADAAPTVIPVNFVTNRARKKLEGMPHGEERDAFEKLLAAYEEALLTESGEIDEIEDDLIEAMENR